MAGRPSKFTPELQKKMLALYEKGKTDKEVARTVGVSVRALHYWKAGNFAFLHSIKGAKKIADDLVEAALFRCAMGYTYNTEKIFLFKGKPVRVETFKHCPPNPTAMIFWLKNRCPERWRW